MGNNKKNDNFLLYFHQLAFSSCFREILKSKYTKNLRATTKKLNNLPGNVLIILYQLILVGKYGVKAPATNQEVYFLVGTPTRRFFLGHAIVE